MFNATLDKQLMITVNNQVGTLADVTKVVSSSGINVIAVCAYAVDNRGVIMFVCDDSRQAQKLLKAKKYDVREEEIVLISLDNKPGTLQLISEKISAIGVDVTLLYGSVEKKGKTSQLVLVTEDNAAVLMALRN